MVKTPVLLNKIINTTGVLSMNDILDFSILHNITEEKVEYISRHSSLRCSCGKFKKIRKSSQSKVGIALYRTCGDSKCEPNYGKKRPEHSKKMKELVFNGSEKYKNTLIKPGQKHNKDVNSISFKRKRLLNSGYDITGVSDDNIIKLYSKLLSDFNTNINSRKKAIVKRYEKWEEEYKKLILIITDGIIPTKEWVSLLTDTEANEIWTRIHGVNTIRNWVKIEKTRNSFFKQESLSGFKYNKIQKKVFVKSGLEKEYIEFFEDNGIEWEYETLVIETKNKDGFYIPDFIITLDNRRIILETKGSFYRTNIDEYIDNKVGGALIYCKENGYDYVLTQKKPDKELKFIEHALVRSNYVKN